MTDKDIQMTVCGLLKSVIEAGIPPHQWEENTREALLIWRDLYMLVQSGKLKKETAS